MKDAEYEEIVNKIKNNTRAATESLARKKK